LLLIQPRAAIESRGQQGTLRVSIMTIEDFEYANFITQQSRRDSGRHSLPVCDFSQLIRDAHT
jgi:hypothetical protein